MPKCIGCGGDVGMEEEICSFCGALTTAHNDLNTVDEQLKKETLFVYSHELKEELSLGKYFIKSLHSYVNFEGRARRKEYWGFILFTTIITLALGILQRILADKGFSSYSSLLEILSILFWCAIIIPYFAVTIRRLHDINYSGWSFFWSFIPIIGGFYLIYLLCKDGDHGVNDYGDNPK